MVPKLTWVLHTKNLFSPWEEKMLVATNDTLCADILYTWNGITYLWVDILRLEDVPLVEFMYLVFTRMQGESYRRQLRSLLLCLCDVFRALINSLVSWCSNNILKQEGEDWRCLEQATCTRGPPAWKRYTLTWLTAEKSTVVSSWMTVRTGECCVV